jgi:hypothetical protein
MAGGRELVKSTKSIVLNRNVVMIGRSLVVLLMLCLWIRPGFAEPGAVQQIAPEMYAWQGDRDKREPANCMWVIFKDYIVVVDANFSWAANGNYKDWLNALNRMIGWGRCDRCARTRRGLGARRATYAAGLFDGDAHAGTGRTSSRKNRRATGN